MYSMGGKHKTECITYNFLLKLNFCCFGDFLFYFIFFFCRKKCINAFILLLFRKNVWADLDQTEQSDLGLHCEYLGKFN